MHLETIYNKQIEFQKRLLEVMATKGQPSITIPKEDVAWFSYHIQGMVEELGEVLRADKRWKTHRNDRFEYDEKVDEVVDVIITALNLAIYTGISEERLADLIVKKMDANVRKFDNQQLEKITPPPTNVRKQQ